MPTSYAAVHRLRPRHHRQIDTLQGTLDLGGWSEPVRVEVNERLSRFLPDTLPNGWRFVMVSSEAEGMQAFLKAVGSGPRAFSTLAVWNAMLPVIRRDTGEIICGQRKIAEISGVSLGDVPRAIRRLIEMGVLIKEGRGHYRVHPSFMWSGKLTKRAAAVAASPQLKLVGDHSKKGAAD